MCVFINQAEISFVCLCAFYLCLPEWTRQKTLLCWPCSATLYVVRSNSNVTTFGWGVMESSSWTVMMEDNSHSLSQLKYSSSRMNSLQLKHKLTKGGPCTSEPSLQATLTNSKHELSGRLSQLWVSGTILGQAGGLWNASSHAPEHIIWHPLCILSDYVGS